LSAARKQDLFIPMYLDTNTLLDILASVEEGFSVVEKITSTSTDLRSSQQAVKGDFGVAALWNVFKINLKGEADRGREQQAGEDHSTERYHTYGSLMNKLKSILEDKGLLTGVTSDKLWESARPSDFVEIRGKFVPNPLRESLESLAKFIRYWFFLQQFPSANPNLIAQNNPNLIVQNPALKNMYAQMKVMLKDFEPEGIHTYIVESTELPEHKVVVKLFSEYIRDRTGRELPYGEFRMLGKVIRKINKGDSINLIEGSTFSLLGDEPTTQFLKVFEDIGRSGIKIPKVTPSIVGLAMQVIPIAIYV
jgi:hypothetical protein